MSAVVDELEKLTTSDPRVSIVPRSSLHFTFLALTTQRWETIDAMTPPPDIVRQLSAIPFELERLELLPTPNALLLAGVPTDQTLVARNDLIEKLMETQAASWLKERYGAMFPPIFWHTTLARSKSEFCPQGLRDIYHRHQSLRVERIALDCPELWAVNFDWTIRKRV